MAPVLRVLLGECLWPRPLDRRPALRAEHPGALWGAAAAGNHRGGITRPPAAPGSSLSGDVCVGRMWDALSLSFSLFSQLLIQPEKPQASKEDALKMQGDGP